MIRIFALLSLFYCIAPLQMKAALLTASNVGCSRLELQTATDKYLAALNYKTPSGMPLTAEAKYIENGKKIPFGEGIWQTPIAINFHRSFLDIDTCETFTEIIHTSSNHPYVIGTRLKIVGDKISEIEALITDQDDWLFNAGNYLNYSSRETWNIIPPAQRSNRETLIKVANAYFDVFSDRSASSKVPWGIPCARLEGGAYTNPKGDPKASCIGGPPLEGSIKIVNRRFLVDVDMGTAIGLANFGDENGWPDAHMFRLENGKVRYVHTLTVCPDGCKLPDPKSN
jgi:hypothetical protein